TELRPRERAAWGWEDEARHAIAGGGQGFEVFHLVGEEVGAHQSGGVEGGGAQEFLLQIGLHDQHDDEHGQGHA
ncbi:hypothetical protein HMPREF0519_0805, partial [Lentilactobacillus hilgardii DSM 20176 = ATCC 8290]